MISIEPVVTIASLVDHPDAELMNLPELVSNNYLDDMEKLYVPMSTVDQGDSFIERESIEVTGSQTVPLGTWCGGRLYAEGECQAFTVKNLDGLWTYEGE